MSSIAERIYETYDDWTSAETEMAGLAYEVDQDWKKGSTIWKFGDGSAIVAIGPDWKIIN